jgi:NitT/TauT family transport system ATP-binding protein
MPIVILKTLSTPCHLRSKHLGQSFQHGKTERTVLNQINLKIHKREFICVIGPSGCGKSTLSRIVAGLDDYSSGEVLVDGERVMVLALNADGISGIYPISMENRQRKCHVRTFDAWCKSGAAESVAREWINIIGLEKYENQCPHQLSGGMKQRVAIARALVNEPKILLMDEPLEHLTHIPPEMQRHLMDLWQNIDITILFVTHDMDEAILLADRIVVLKANPGEVKEIIEVRLPCPRTPELMNTSEFRQLRAHVDELVHAQEEEQVDPALQHLPEIPRMTQVSQHK